MRTASSGIASVTEVLASVTEVFAPFTGVAALFAFSAGPPHEATSIISISEIEIALMN